MARDLLLGAAVGSAGLVALLVGTAWYLLRPPGRTLRGVIQHVAAGTVFAGLTVDVLARLVRSADIARMVAGMLLGLAAMLVIRTISHRREQRGGEGSSLGIAIVTDVLTDGLLMGLSIVASLRVGIVFAIALFPEIALLGVTVSRELDDGRGRTSRRRSIVRNGAIGVGMVVTGAAGAWLQWTQTPWITLVEGWGAIALAYLVLEELLREAHEETESPWIVATFFAAFIALFAAGTWVKSRAG